MKRVSSSGAIEKPCQWMIVPANQHWFVGHQRMEFDVGRRLEHRSDREVDLALAQ